MGNTATIIFDFDGTLHDSIVIYRKALQMGYDWLVERGEAAPRKLEESQMTANIGLTAKEAWGIMCPEIPWEVTQHAAAQVGKMMDQLIDAGEARLYSGVPAMLSELSDAGHTLVFLSNCRDAYCDAVRRVFGFDQWFANRYYTAESFGGIPKEQIFETVREEIPGPYIAVGDRHKDLALARAHCLPSIGCTYGYGTADELADATCLAATPGEIPALVAEICAR